MFGQIFSAGRLDRSFYTSLRHDNYATGNAVVVIVLVSVLPVLAAPSVVAAASAALWSIVRAGLAAGAVWAAGVHLFKRYGSLASAFRLVGFAHVAFLPLIAAVWADLLRIPLLALSLLWFFLALRVVADALFDMRHPRNSFLAAAGVLGWYIGTILFPAAV